LTETQLGQIIKSSQLHHYAAKAPLFEAGTVADRFYLVRKGQIKLFCMSAEGDEKVVEIVYPQQTFAEAIMFMKKMKYPVSAEAIVETEVYSFNMKSFQQLLHDSNETCLKLLASMSQRLHTRIDDINNLTLHNATYRLVIYLLEQLPPDAVTLSAIHLSTPKSVIASRLSIQPETFSRILTRLSAKQLISVKGNDVTLLDVDGLRDIL
jgi:CRP-like cAMP-binding protein